MTDTPPDENKDRAIDDLLAVMRKLRDPDGGCPWDLVQTFETIAPYTIEEAYEVVDAIHSGDMDLLEDELGDLLLQVVFHSQMSSEAGGFTFDDVARRVADKMRDRHPHVFGPSPDRSSNRLEENWETRKALEREQRARRRGQPPSALDGVALALPALMRSQKLQKRAANVGFDWRKADDVTSKILEELQELRDEMAAGDDAGRLQEEAGDLLFACVNLVRKLGLDAEVALREANDKFSHRFRAVESRLALDGNHPRDCSLSELEALWEAAKTAEKSSSPER